MKLWLDDIRLPPPGWLWVKTAPKAILALKEMNFDEVSLDHDLGEDSEAGCGYDVVLYLEEQAALGNHVPSTISVHSANPVGRNRMEQGIASIQRFLLRK